MCQRHVPSLSLSLSLLFSQPYAGSHGSKRNQKEGGGGKKSLGGTSIADMVEAEQKRKKTIQGRLGKEREIKALRQNGGSEKF